MATKKTKTVEPEKPVDLGIAEEDDLESVIAGTQPPPPGFDPKTGDVSLVDPTAGLQEPEAPVVSVSSPEPTEGPEPEPEQLWIVVESGYVALPAGLTPVNVGTILRPHTHDMDAFRAAQARGQIAFEPLGSL